MLDEDFRHSLKKEIEEGAFIFVFSKEDKERIIEELKLKKMFHENIISGGQDDCISI